MQNREIEILVVEDNAADARLLKEALIDTRLPHRICRSVDGEDAINYLRERRDEGIGRFPNVIVLDLNMPKVNGHQFLKLLNTETGLPEIPVIVLTVSQDEEDVIQALQYGMNFYLRKPPSAVNIDPILERVVSLWAKA
jgi:chemotaxis family two-component system response regulator Rcp1